ncbi:ABC transporter ATP-binding protein [Natribaculum luteum]|uniref:Cobalamin import ATP-binding protein BtuD n=1 Tax=Natribaculum luteum TaxID=1586232 RepID=A0ABD5P5W4_9EURY|nr:ABC transporter ATP-binding protein [Natribaculum luteum]
MTRDRRHQRDESHAVLTGTELRLEYPDATEPVIEDVTIDVPAESTVALIGPNGSGKSTLLRGLSRKLSPSDGQVVLDGCAIQQYGTRELARQLGFLAQRRPSPDGLTVAELVEHGRYPHRGFFDGISDEDREAIERAIERARLEPIRDRPVDDLSGGQQQLAWIGMCLAQDSEVLLVDEPLTHLDLRNQLLVLEVLTGLEDRTVVAALHDLQYAARFGDRVAALDGGEIYDSGTPSTVLTETLLADVFGIDATVSQTNGEVRVYPERPLETETTSTDGSSPPDTLSEP